MKKTGKTAPPRRQNASRYPAMKLKALVRKTLIVLAFLAVPIAWLMVNEHTASAESDLSINDLTYDAQGNHQETIQGVTSVNSLRDSFEQLVASRR